MAKPTSFRCNLNCKYCFYLEKRSLYGNEKNISFTMSNEVLKNYIKSYIASQTTDVIEFAWQGGEPTLAGLDYFKLAIGYQEKYAQGKTIRNTLQTNGLLIDEKWARFFAQHQFLVGISIDGLAVHHDRYRITQSGQGSFNKVINAINLLNQYQVDYNTLTVVNDQNYKYGREIYWFLKSIGSNYHQYIPIVEADDLKFVRKQSYIKINRTTIKPFSVPRTGYGHFMTAVFDEWIKEDVGKVFVQLFDATLMSWFGYDSSVCVFNKQCGQSLIIERNGDIYSCDHFVYPEFKLGNIQECSLSQLYQSQQQKLFSLAKLVLSEQCKKCDFQFACYGGCPKHRIDSSIDHLPHNYLCGSYKHYFNHVRKYMSFMVKELHAGRNVFAVMNWAKTQ